MQTFQGVTERDTTEHEVVFCPAGNAVGEQTPSDNILLFRFSKHLGLVDNDDFAGVPYFISIEDLNIIPPLTTAADGEKRSKNDQGIMVNMPGKVKVRLMAFDKNIKTYEMYMAQYGRLESLPSSLFSKKMTSRVVLNPVTGNIESLSTEPLE